MSIRQIFTALAASALVAVLLLPTAAQADAPKVGQPAPDFRLQDQTGKWVTLKEQRGKWVVLYFYPKDNTPGCTTQACEFRDDIFAFRRANVVILGVSVDDLESKKDFAKEHSLPFQVLADPDKQVTKGYGVLTSMLGLMEFARRDTFIIDPQGKIVRHWEKVDATGHSQRVLAELKKLQAPGA
ncbi:MAG: peroxiredoxin [Gammaproteobacteria bacterium]|nr:peroxiredoxin [Gammaproteobacteria bacterium]